MESPVSTTNTSVYGIPIACSNCCELLFPTKRTDSHDYDPNQGFESQPVYELTQEEQVLAISSVLERIYRYGQLRDLNDYEEGLVENAPLCQKCANILNQMDILHQEFDRLRRLESYLSRKVDKVDAIIRDRIMEMNLQLVAEDGNTRFSEDSPVVVKTEPEEPIEILQPSGPWVVLKRLRPAEISERLEVAPEELLSVDHLGDDNFLEVDCVDNDDRVSECFQEMEFEPVYKKEDTSYDITDDDTASCSYKKIRRSKRNAGKLAGQSTQLAEYVDTTAKCKEKTNVAKKRTSIETSCSEIDEDNKKTTRKASLKKPKQRRVKHSRLIDFYRRKQIHPYPCYYCQECFDMESDRIEHLRGVHCTTDRPVICPPCGKLFSNEQSRQLHEPKCGVVPSHYVMPPYICKDCGKELKTHFSLQSHQRNLHSTERPFACPQCEYRCKNTTALALHKKYKHTVVVPVECPDCHKVLKNQAIFEQHYKQMHTPEGNSSYKEQMKRSSAKGIEIRRLNRITTSVCLECNLDFQTVARYKRHRNEVHTTSKKWQCEQCGKGFNIARVFKEHQRFVHTNERPFICDQCAMQFKSPKNLRAHVLRVHTEEGRLKFNEYNKVNYRRKQRLAQELLKIKEAEVLDDQRKVVPLSSGTSFNNERGLD